VTDGRSIRVERWWQPERCPASSPGDTGAVIGAAVRRQLVSDVPVGVFLSGGVDSAAVADAASAGLPTLSTFTVGFDEASYDETARAQVVSDALGTRAHVIRLTQEEYVAGLSRAVWHLDAPLNHAHSVHLLALSRFARERITVALTGEGSDELFAGYPRYRLFLLAQRLRGLPAPLLQAGARRLRRTRPRWARLLEAAASDVATAAAVNPAFLPIDEAAALAGADDLEAIVARRRVLFAEARAGGEGEVGALLALERRTYLASLLQRMDRMSMAAGLECRVPLLDERVLAHACALPVSARIDLRTTKKPVRALAEARFGRSYAHAPKSGFGVPLDTWLRGGGPFATFVESVLFDGRARSRGWFDADAARRLFEEHRNGRQDRSEHLWGLANLELWARICCDGEDPSR
jgi:asparagine synthase (glutamine-hydrolysing)